MFLFSKKLFVLGAIFVSSSLTAFAGEDQCDPKKQMCVVEVDGNGNGCLTDLNNEKNWEWRFNSAKQILVVKFDDFRLDRKRDRSECSLDITLKYPKGKTVFVYASEVTGYATVKPDEYVLVQTRLRLPGRTYRFLDKELPEGFDGRWKSRLPKYKGNQEAPCDGTKYSFDFDIFATREGEDSTLEVTTKKGQFTKLEFKLLDADDDIPGCDRS